MCDRGRLAARRGRSPFSAVPAVILAVIAVAAMVGACGRRADHPAEAVSTSAETATQVTRPTASPVRAETPIRLLPTIQASPPPAEPLVALATADAARRTGAAPESVRIVRVEAREWPDRSLGCPRPGMGYAQAITPGYLIVAEAAGQRFEYHTDHAQVVLCSS